MNISSSEADRLRVSVIVCTYNRDSHIVNVLHSILQNAGPSFEVLIFDQSTNDKTQNAVVPFLSDPRLRYVHSNTIGLGLARRLSLHLVTGDIILMTDDDCEVAPDWIAQMVAAHLRYPKAAVVFCNVLPGPHDPEKGFIPYTIAREDTLLSTVYQWCRAGAANVGIGAGIGIRRTLIEAIGGFDSRLGAGTPLHCAEETDLAVRALLHGHQVYRTTATYVVHHGFRTFEQGRGLMRGYMLGIAAAYTKLLRCGYKKMCFVLLYELWRTVLYPTFHSFSRLRVPPVLGRSTYLLKGFVTAWQIPIDATHEVFQPLHPSDHLVTQPTVAEPSGSRT